MNIFKQSFNLVFFNRSVISIMYTKLIYVFLLAYAGSLNGLSPRQALVSRLNFFDTDLLRFATDERPGNIVVSPASMKAVLAMLLEGAAGKSATEIINALRLSPKKNEYREQLNVYLVALQSNATTAQVESANAVFVSDKHQLKKEYMMMLKNVYQSEIQKVKFSDAVTAAETINKWVNSTTKGLIPQIVESSQLSISTDVFIANAIYFKSSWKFAFNPRLTRRACFYNKGICRNVAMMELQGELNYAYVENLRAHAVELPYEGDKYSMIILVPQDKDGWMSLVRDLPYMSLPQISALMDPNDVQLSMPKFNIDYTEDLVPILKSMKIEDIFSATANLSDIFEGHCPQVNNVYHKVHLNVDEKGTVATAATGAVVIPLIGSLVTLKVDRPFLFFIRDNDLGIVLFEGKIDDPTSFDASALNDFVDPSLKNVNGPPKTKSTKT